MSVIQSPANSRKAQCTGVDEVATLPGWLELLFKVEERLVFFWIAKAPGQKINAIAQERLSSLRFALLSGARPRLAISNPQLFIYSRERASKSSIVPGAGWEHGASDRVPSRVVRKMGQK